MEPEGSLSHSQKEGLSSVELVCSNQLPTLRWRYSSTRVMSMNAFRFMQRSSPDVGQLGRNMLTWDHDFELKCEFALWWLPYS